MTPLSLDPSDRLEARPRGACPGRTRESGGPDLQGDWEFADTERANRIEKTNFLPGQVRTSSLALWRDAPLRGLPRGSEV